MRDGINIARFAIKLKSLATAARPRDATALETAILRNAGRRGAALCPARPICRSLMPAACERGRFTYFPVVPGRLEFAIELRQAILRERPQVVAVELPVISRRRLSAAHGAAAGDVGDPLSR